VYSLVCSDSNYTPISFRFDKPVAVHFDRFAFERGEPRLFVLDFHRLIQIDLQPASLPVSQVQYDIRFVANYAQSIEANKVTLVFFFFLFILADVDGARAQRPRRGQSD
jgi:hypothetical protein